jgi:hypothetical protein
MDQYMIDVILNDIFPASVAYDETPPIVIEFGSTVDLTNQLSEALRGYVSVDDIQNAIPTSITINSLPSCGTLYRSAVNDGE